MTGTREPSSNLPAGAASGAETLLKDCVGLQRGESLLLVEESAELGYYDQLAPQQVMSAALAMGARVTALQAPDQETFRANRAGFLEQLSGYDHVVFLARIGDQIRFARDTRLGSATMVYTLGADMLESEFGTACHYGMCEVKAAIDSAFLQAEEIELTCPLGSHYVGKPRWPAGEAQEVTLKRFPMLVPIPIPAAGFSGRIVVSRFLVGTGSQTYSPYTLDLTSDVVAFLDNDRITAFEGAPDCVAKIEHHYDHVASLFNLDAYCVHSWHAGIHPGCWYHTPAYEDLHRWSGSAFGNPRLMHMHTCGDYAPGEISWNIVDPTIRVDDVLLWENGRLHPQRLASGAEIFDSHPHLEMLFANPRTDIGL